MDEKVIQALISQVINQQIIGNWLYWLLMLAVAFLGAVLGPYFKKRGENLATKADFQDIKSQLDETTKLTEQIKAEVGHVEWRNRERITILRGKLEEIMMEVNRAKTELDREITKVAYGEATKVDAATLMRLDVLVNLYVPEMKNEAVAWSNAWRGYIKWAYKVNVEISKSGVPFAADMERADKIRDEMLEWYGRASAAEVALSVAVNKKMQELLNLPT